MDKTNHLPNVRNMYENYPFPLRDPRDEKRRLHTCEMEMLPKINHYCYRGKQSFDQGFRALVAGGGAGDAAIYLAHHLKGRNAEVVYLDMSTASMAIAKERAAIRKLNNIQWIHGSILELPKLGLEPFDYINCVGVLHHMADPDEGLKALAAVLAPGGAMGLMVYGHYGRLDIYATQDLMRHANRNEPDLARKVENAKALLRCLPNSNLLMRGRARDSVLHQLFNDDSNLVDAFLHEQDRAYTVPEAYQFVEGAGLNLIEFTNYEQKDGVCRVEYDPMWYARSEPTLTQTLTDLSKRERQAVAEVINGCIGLHAFYVTKERDTIARYDDPENVPSYLTAGALAQCRRIQNLPEGSEVTVGLRYGNQIALNFGPLAIELISLIDGKRTLGDIAEHLSKKHAANGAPNPTQVLQQLAPELDILNMMNWIVLRHCSVPEIPPLEVSASFTLSSSK